MPLTFDAPAVLGVLAAGTLYVRAARGRGWPPGRTTAFLAGLATILVVTCSPLAVYDTTFFWVRAVQTVTLLMITPLLLALGAPIRLLLDTVDAGWLRRHGRGRPARRACRGRARRRPPGSRTSAARHTAKKIRLPIPATTQ